MSNSSNDLNLINASQYDIYSKLLYIASKYTNVENTDFLRSGLFGYITESMAMILRDSSIHKTMLYNESFLNTAVLPKSIYNWAKMFNVNVNSATPAYADVDIIISESDFLSYSRIGVSYGTEKYGPHPALTSDKEKVIIIDKGSTFSAGSIPFTLEHSILLRKNGNAYIAEYLDQEENITTNFQFYKTPVLKTTFTSDSTGERFITINARLYQYKINEVSKIIATSSFIDRKVHEFDFPDQFVGAACKYEKNGEVKDIDLIFSNLTEIDSNYYCFYSLLNTNKLQLKFSDNVGAFKPASNSKLDVSIYTSLGSKGNIAYTGNVICRLNDELLRNLAITIRFSTDKAVGGVDAPSLSEIKKKVINEISTRDVIVTETDLNNYFSVLKSMLESINNGQVRFVKKRDDILRRIFTAYILFKNPSDGKYIPSDIQTHTDDVIFTPGRSDSLSLKFGQKVVYDSSTEKFIVSNNATEELESFIIPFYVYVALDPIRRVKYIYNLANDSAPLSITKDKLPNLGNSANGTIMIPDTVEVYRGFNSSEIDKTYRFTFKFTTNFQFQKPSSGTFNLIFQSPNSNSSLANFSINMNDVEFYSGGSEADANGLFYPYFTISVEADENEFNFANDWGSTISINGTQLTENIVPRLELKNVNINAANATSVSIDVTADESVSLFRNLDDVMQSDILTNKNANGKAVSYTLKSVPLLSTKFTTTEETVSNFIDQLFTYINMLKENLEKLETNTFFDLKFFNSFGNSKYYNTHRTDLKLELEVRLKSGLNKDNYEYDIKHYIQSIVDQSNEEGTLKVSHVISQTVATFYDVIENIDFLGLNNSFTQYIKPIDYGTAKERIQLTPEHFGIPDENLQYIHILNYNEEAQY